MMLMQVTSVSAIVWRMSIVTVLMRVMAFNNDYIPINVIARV